MNDFANLMRKLQDAWHEALASVATILPLVIGALLLVLIGWLAAKLARGTVVRLANFINRSLQTVRLGTPASHLTISPQVVRIVGNAAYWLVILIFLTAAARALQLDAFSMWLARILNYAPILLAGGLIIAAGFIASMFVRDVVSTGLSSAGFAQGAVLGSAAQAAVLLTAVIIGVDQIGVDVSFLTTIIAIILAGLVSGFALAFGIGSRDFVANIIAANELRQHYAVGQTVRVRGTVGEVVELTSTSVILETNDSRTSIPAQLFHQSPSMLITEEQSDE